MRVLELFSGIGGAAQALPKSAQVVCAVDQNVYARSVYKANYPGHRIEAWNLATLWASKLERLNADLWWMSPPCQPFTVRGIQRDLDDRRCEPLKRVMTLIPQLRPPRIALENVVPFAESRAHAQLQEVLSKAGYRVRTRFLCPTELGIPMQRPRFYLIASLNPLPDWWPLRSRPRRLESYLDEAPAPETEVSPALLKRYADALPISDTRAFPRACVFTSAYGKSPVYAGSYWRDHRGIRRFSHREILRLLGFSSDFQLTDDLPAKRPYALIGNSLSVDAVRVILAPLFTNRA
ncbi:MAG: DNA methyltransferase [Rhodobacterales bacterium]|nr:DNA methyltransferase [Rhodobacterales bacterium]